MLIIREPAEASAAVDSRRSLGRIVLVPTMGALHRGHVSLMRLAHEAGDSVVVSIFVNPLQFGDRRDFDTYPIDLDRDLALCAQEKVDVVWAPTAAQMYPEGFASKVIVGDVSHDFEGRHRPGHFDGVATVVTKLFSVVRPDVAVFGAKDFQQVAVIRRLVSDFGFPIDIVVAPTVRDEDGLALSSRNVRLNPSARRRALAIPEAVLATRLAWDSGERDVVTLARMLRTRLEGLDVDYADIVDAVSLRAPTDRTKELVALVAATVDGVRLIDNIVLD